MLKAYSGNAEAMHELGHCYEQGIDVKQDLREAYLWYSICATIFDYKLSKIRLIFVKKQLQSEDVSEYNEKINLWNSAYTGDAESQFQMAIYHYTNEDFDDSEKNRAFDWMLKAANQNHAVAMCDVGTFYEHGVGCVQDPELAKEWYSKAVAQGNASAMCNLGLLLFFDSSEKNNREEGISLLKQAVEKDHYPSMMSLAQIYVIEKYGHCNYEESMSLLEKAEKTGQIDSGQEGFCNSIIPAGEFLTYIFLFDGISQITYSEEGIANLKRELNVKIQERNAESGPTSQKRKIGECYYSGTNGFPQDLDKAIQWYKKTVIDGDINELDRLIELVEEKKAKEVTKYLERKIRDEQETVRNLERDNRDLRNRINSLETSYENKIASFKRDNSKLKEICLNLQDNNKKLEESNKKLQESKEQQNVSKDNTISKYSGLSFVGKVEVKYLNTACSVDYKWVSLGFYNLYMQSYEHYIIEFKDEYYKVRKLEDKNKIIQYNVLGITYRSKWDATFTTPEHVCYFDM